MILSVNDYEISSDELTTYDGYDLQINGKDLKGEITDKHFGSRLGGMYLPKGRIMIHIEVTCEGDIHCTH
jgi:hypothetical protein